MSTNGQLVFTDVDKITFKGVGNASNAVIDTLTGKIGVGVDSPDANLHVLGNSYVSTNLELGGTLIMGTVNVEAQHSLEAVTATGNTTPLTIEFTNPTTSLVASGNVVVTGNVTADHFVGDGSNITGISSTLQAITDSGNVTSNTVQFTNPTTSLVASGNVEVGGELTVSGNTTVSSNLTVSGNVVVTGSITGRIVTKTRTITHGTSLSGEVDTYTLETDENRIVLNNAQGTAGSSRTYTANFNSGVPTEVGTIMYLEINSSRTATSAAGVNHKTEIQFGGTKVLSTGDNYIASSGTYSKTLKRVIILTSNGWEDITEIKHGDNGRVGIGQSSPSTKLHIGSGDVGIDRDQKFDFGAGYSANWYIKQKSADNKIYFERTGGNGNELVIDTSGKVGIGTATPHAKLHIIGGAGSVTGASRRYFNHQYALTHDTGTTGNMSIFCNEAICTDSYFIAISGTVSASDERIKKEIVDVEDASALDTIRLLKPKKYKYKDEVRRGTEPVWGFIAQEVRETLSYATQLRQDSIPNIYEMVNISTDSSVITFTNFDTSTLESGTKVLKVFDESDTEHFITFTEVIDDNSLRIEEDLSKWTQLFVYGQRVDDFVFVQKDAIWTVATAALQEVDRQLQAEKEKVTTLETQLASVLTRLDALENT